jgi:hypothetical protein
MAYGNHIDIDSIYEPYIFYDKISNLNIPPVLSIIIILLIAFIYWLGIIDYKSTRRYAFYNVPQGLDTRSQK